MAAGRLPVHYKITYNCNNLTDFHAICAQIDVFEVCVLGMVAVPEKYIALVDMCFLWRLATPSAEDREKPDGSVFTWGDYADKLFSIAL